MHGTVRLVLGSACALMLAGCGSPGPVAEPDGSASAVTSPSGSATASSSTPTEADLMGVMALLYPVSPNGGDCLTGSGGAPASLLACPVTQRLAAALSAALADPNAPADPLCGCQAIDAHQTASFSPNVPAGAGTIHVTAFGSQHVAYLVVASASQFVVDDIIYCSPSPHSIYAGETVTAC